MFKKTIRQFACFFSVFTIIHSSFAFAQDPSPQLKEYVDGTLTPFINNASELKSELAKANRDRANWANFTEEWKAWSPSDAEANKQSYGYPEYRWSVLKDRAFRRLHTSSPAAQLLKTFQSASGGKIQEFFVTDAKGGNVVQTQVTSDWFQGDEDKYTKVANQKHPFYGQLKRDETVGTQGLHVSIPIWDDETFLGVAVIFVVTN